MATRPDGEYEAAFETELMGEFEDELGGAHETLHEDELEMALEGEGEDELELHHEGEYEGEQFFKRLRRLARGVGRFVKSAAPILARVAKVAAPLVATAVGGPLGGMLAKGAMSALGEGEGEDELEAAL